MVLKNWLLHNFDTAGELVQRVRAPSSERSSIFCDEAVSLDFVLLFGLALCRIFYVHLVEWQTSV
jgi:hypothetical protein